MAVGHVQLGSLAQRSGQAPINVGDAVCSDEIAYFGEGALFGRDKGLEGCGIAAVKCGLFFPQELEKADYPCVT